MWDVIKNEWCFLYRSKVFMGLSLAFCCVLGLSLYLGDIQVKKEGKQYQDAQLELRKKWESIDAVNPHRAAHYGTYVFKSSHFLNGLDEGVNTVVGNVLRVEGHVQNEIVYSEASQMQTVATFGKLKSSLLLQYILPLLLLFLAFHSISSEKQSGRLKLLVLQGAKPSSLVWAKLFSIWAYGMALLTLLIVVYILSNFSELSVDVFYRLLLFYFSYACYYFIVTGLTVVFSAHWKNTTVALTTMLGIWMVWTIFLPNIIMSSVENWHELPSRNKFQALMKEDRSKGIDGHNPSDERSLVLKQQTLKKYKVDSLSQLPINFDGIRMQADEEYGNQVWDKHFGELRNVLDQQKQSYRIMGVFNPFISLKNASMGFAASDNLHHQEFLLQVEDYRRAFIKSLNDEHAYGGSLTGDWSWKADRDFYKSIPDYEHRPLSLASVFKNYLLDLLFLGSWVVLVSFLLILGTKKMKLL